MDTYIILAGGYWHLSSKLDLGGFQVDPGSKDECGMVDYIIKIKNLPDEYFKPSEIRKRYMWYCESCQRYVPDIERKEQKGCFGNRGCDIEEQSELVEYWQESVLSKYQITKKGWVTPCYRIFLNNSKGVNVWRDLWRHINSVIPTTVRLVPDLLPIRTGTKQAWEVDESAVPVIELPEIKKEIPKKPEPIKMEQEKPKRKKSDEMVECEICGKEFSKSSINRHMYGNIKSRRRDNGSIQYGVLDGVC